MNPDQLPLQLDRHGWLKPHSLVKKVPSPNFDPRPARTSVSLLVIHNISLPPYQFGGPYIEQFFTNHLDSSLHPFFEEIKNLHVSAHFLIRRNGHIVQFVSTDNMAWHAGVSYFKLKTACNPFSIGIELEGSDFVPFEDVQYQQLAKLTLCLKARYPLSDVRGHEHIAPVRKTDPGPFFDWSRYQADAHWFRRQMP